MVKSGGHYNDMLLRSVAALRMWVRRQKARRRSLREYRGHALNVDSTVFALASHPSFCRAGVYSRRKALYRLCLGFALFPRNSPTVLWASSYATAGASPKIEDFDPTARPCTIFVTASHQASLREGGGFCEAKDERSPRKVLYRLFYGFVQNPVGRGLAPAATPCTIFALASYKNRRGDQWSPES